MNIAPGPFRSESVFSSFDALSIASVLLNHPFVLFGVLLGGALASFGCVVIERSTGSEGLNGRSHCICGRQLTWYENVPVLGWLQCAGKARCCGSRIPAWYVLAEVAGIIACGIGGWFGLLGLGGSIAVLAAVVTVARLRKTRNN